MPGKSNLRIAIDTPPSVHIRIPKAIAKPLYAFLENDKAKKKGSVVKRLSIHRANGGPYQTYEITTRSLSALTKLNELLQKFSKQHGCELENNMWRPPPKFAF